MTKDELFVELLKPVIAGYPLKDYSSHNNDIGVTYGQKQGESLAAFVNTFYENVKGTLEAVADTK